MAQIPPALHGLLGVDVGQVTAAQLGNLLGQGEGQALELKSEVGVAKSEKREFAVDVAALANGGGGLLAVGIEEGGQGDAHRLTGIPADGDTALRFEQILASLVQPPLPLSIGRVSVQGDNEVVLIAVEGGPLRPHAVLDGTSKLSYPVRRGRKKEYLTESEIADSYSRRFTSADRRAGDLTALHRDLAGSLDLQAQGWIALSLLPSSPAFGSIRSDLDRETRQWLDELTPLSGTWWNTRIGYQSVLCADDFTHPNRRAMLRVDGAGAVAWGSLTHWLKDGGHSRTEVEGEPQRFNKHVPLILEDVFESLLLLASYARHAGASGTADVAVQLIAAPDCIVQLTPPDPHRLHYNPLPELVGPSRTTRHTIDLAAVASDPAALLQTSAFLAVGLVSEYGCSDLGAVDEQGRLDTNGATKHTPHLHHWATANGLNR